MIRLPVDIKYIMSCLHPYESWLVGGAVRDYIKYGIWSEDVDIATTSEPQKTMNLLKNKGITVVPTGLKHGTITAVHEGKSYEITTLRKDVSTDGRHADVVFTDIPELDAARRDLTINALYLNASGDILDFFGGKEDLEQGVVRFIGNAEKRIEEDYLRILRFFRFFVSHALHPLDDEMKVLLQRKTVGLAQLSAERVLDEMMKLMKVENASGALDLMSQCGVFDVLGFPKEFDKRDLLKGEPPFIRLLGLFYVDANILPKVLKLSNMQKKAIKSFTKALGNVDGKYKMNHRVLCYIYGKDVMRWVLKIKGHSHIWIEDYTVPVFPIVAADVMSLGIKAGPALGHLLKELELWWLEEEFPSKEKCKDKLKTLVCGCEESNKS